MKIIVTGSESFVGRTLVPLLRARGHEIVRIDEQLDTSLSVIFRYWADRAKGADVIIHLAAASSEKACAADPTEAYLTNIYGTANILDIARRYSISQIIFASSEWVYSDKFGPEYPSYEVHAMPYLAAPNEYVVTKMAGEAILKVGVMRGLKTATILRFGIIYAERDPPGCALESIVRSLVMEGNAVVGNLNTARCYIHVEDICRGIIASIATEPRGFEIYNLAGDALVSFADVAKLAGGSITEKTDGGPPSIRNPNSDAAKAKLGWHPLIGIDEGVRRLADFYGIMQQPHLRARP